MLWQCMDIKHQKEMNDARENAARLVREAKRSKAEVYKPKGNETRSFDDEDEYFHYANRIEPAMVKK